MPPTPTRRRAAAAERPDTQATRPKLRASPPSSSETCWLTGAPPPALFPPAMGGRLRGVGASTTAAGAFSGLFGVGGGTIIVPLLVLWLGYGHKEATGTSLAAIIVIGVLAAAGHAVYGNVDFWKGILIGVPGVAGVVAGTALQQRVSERAVAGAFVVLLLASAAVLVFVVDPLD